MGPLDTLLHLLNFVAPALGVALLLPLGARWTLGPSNSGLPWLKQAAVHGLVGSAVLLAGLWVAGRDAKMISYGALVLAGATTQLLMSRSVRR
jgi:hypothetical protein